MSALQAMIILLLHSPILLTSNNNRLPTVSDQSHTFEGDIHNFRRTPHQLQEHQHSSSPITFNTTSNTPQLHQPQSPTETPK